MNINKLRIALRKKIISGFFKVNDFLFHIVISPYRRLTKQFGRGGGTGRLPTSVVTCISCHNNLLNYIISYYICLGHFCYVIGFKRDHRYLLLPLQPTVATTHSAKWKINKNRYLIKYWDSLCIYCKLKFNLSNY